MLRAGTVSFGRFAAHAARTPALTAPLSSAVCLSASAFARPSVAQDVHAQWWRQHLNYAATARSENSAQDEGLGIREDEAPHIGNAVPGSQSYNPAPHPSHLTQDKGEDYMLHHPVYTQEYVESIKPAHRKPNGVLDWLAYYSIQSVRATFDIVTNYGAGKMNKRKWLTRVVFLETVAGVPGMVAGMIRHLHSLRLMKRDHGWIHTLLEEAENERMHLLTFMQLKQPGPLFRGMVLLAQGVYCNLFFVSYLVSPEYCHRLVGYLEEEAVKTYTHLIEDIDAGQIPEWVDEPAPGIAIEYWRLKEDATMRDLVLAVRADEACHAHVNHTFAGLKAGDANPFTSRSDYKP